MAYKKAESLWNVLLEKAKIESLWNVLLEKAKIEHFRIFLPKGSMTNKEFWDTVKHFLTIKSVRIRMFKIRKTDISISFIVLYAHSYC